MNISRRGFLALSGAICSSLILGNDVEAWEGKYAMLVDLTKCDGCKDEPIPKCVKACREYNKERFPEPKKPIQPYWPRKTYEDWSDKRGKIDNLTPYNWIFVQRISIDGQELYIPRRCMHCDNPPCVRECPFGALTKQPEGNSVINDKLCFGGAKCRDVCPWHIPQRQAGVGIYLKILPKYAGGGVMYKCDLCKDKIKKGEEPACVVACRERLGQHAASIVFVAGVIFHIFYHGLRKDFALLPKKGDLSKSIKVLAAMIGIGKEPPSDKYLPEQRIAYLGIGAIILILTVTGIIKVLKNLQWIVLSPTMESINTLIHTLTGFLFMIAFIVHVGTVLLFKSNWPLLKSMFTGWIDEEYIKHRHSLWYEKIKMH